MRYPSPQKPSAPRIAPQWRLLLLIPFSILLVVAFVGVAIGQDVASEDVIHLGDLVDVDVIGSTDFDWRGEVTPEGFLAGIRFTESPIAALCKTTEEVSNSIKSSYERFLNDPSIRVTILDRSGRAPAVLFGAVRNQHRFRLLRSVSLRELIVVAGGVTAAASGEVTILRRPTANCAPVPNAGSEGIDLIGESFRFSVSIKDLLSGKTEANPLILYGDVVTVEESGPVFVMGGIVNPSRIAFREGLSLSRAVASAGGLVKEADPGRVTIFRRDADGSRVIKADLSSIDNGTADDIPLVAYDIVDVATSGSPDRRYAPFDEVESFRKTAVERLPLRIID